MALEVWTDGGCHGNPGAGGWAFVIARAEGTRRETLIERCGGEKLTTNNRMELLAVINALEYLRASPEFSPEQESVVYTDSEYVKKGITAWIHDWKARGWKTAAKKPVKNQDLWQRLDGAAARLLLRWQWVRGHSGAAMNERCDALTQKAIAEIENAPPLCA